MFFKKFISSLVGIFGVLLTIIPYAHAWGRHDLITKVAMDAPEFRTLRQIPVPPESIQHAAPDLLKRVIPGLELWAERYHKEYDTRYAWSAPKPKPNLSPRAQLLWMLDDNMNTPLKLGHDVTAADILEHYSMEPDGQMDGGLDRPPYIKRLRAEMSYWDSNDSHTHAFRHYYVPSSLIPPIITPRGMAPYRAALYAQLSVGAFKTGHPYWGYRFLAWSLHYVQDVTQPWHTVFVPGISFLSFSKAKMKHEIEALHYLTEAFADSWMENASGLTQAKAVQRIPAFITKVSYERNLDPWFVAKLTVQLAKSAHAKSGEIAELARDFFQPIVDQLGPHLKLKPPVMKIGGLKLVSATLDFSGNGDGATRFLKPMWGPGFTLWKKRDKLMTQIAKQLNSAIGGSRVVVSQILNESRPGVSLDHLSGVDGSFVGYPS